MCSIAFSLQSLRSKCHVKRHYNRYSMMETKEPDFVSTMSRTIKCNHCSKLLVNQQGLFYTVKKTKENCIVFTDASTHKIISIPFKNLSLGFILKIILKFCKFQPRYSYKIYYKKECMCQAAHQASTDKNNLTKKNNLPSSCGLFTMSDYKALRLVHTSL